MLQLFFSSNQPRKSIIDEEYDDMIKSNIFPSVSEDFSEASCTFECSFHDSSSMSLSTTSTSTSEEEEEEEEEKVQEQEEQEQKLTEVEALRAELAALRLQLASRDRKVEELECQVAKERRVNATMRTKWDLFFGSSSNADNEERKDNDNEQPDNDLSLSSLPMPSASHHHVVAKPHQLNAYISKLEADKKATLQKAVQLSVALAESKAQVSTLTAELEESQQIILYQCTGTSKHCSSQRSE